MNRFFVFIDKHKFGLIAALMVYLGLFLYFHLETYQKIYLIPVWDERAELEDPEIAIKPENIEINSPQNPAGDIKSISRDANDSRDKSYDNWSKDKASKEAEQRVKEWEQQDFKESGGEAKREQLKREQENKLKNQNKTNTNVKTEKTTNQGGNTAFKGSVMVEWQLKDRQPHLNDSWQIRNPGYTCGEGSTGTVFIKIKVNQSGQVVSAVYVATKSSQANACMIEQALKYAKLSRFNYESKATTSQEGYINYVFVAQ